MNPVVSPARRRHYPLHRALNKGRPSLPGQGYRPLQGELRSTFALEQLSALAQRCLAPEFITLLAPVLGLDIPAPAYLKLQAALDQGQLAVPACRIVEEGTYPADYDSAGRVIRIHCAALAWLQDNPDASWQLLEVLLHEFGHHLDTVLREDFASPALLVPDASGDEGTRYTRRMAEAGWAGEQHILLASYLDAEGRLINLQIEPRKALRRILSSHAAIGTASTGNGASHPEHPGLEGFEASGDEHGKFSHERIENVLLELGFAEHERQAVYFGNWLRDYSQLLDPKLVRGPDMPKNFPNSLSRPALTEIIDILATRKFAEARLDDPDTFKVSPARLGVYRPTEHIDNPRVEPPAPFDLAERDKDFERWVLKGDPALQVDADSSVKNYIWRSVDFMQEQLRAAMQHGRNPEGLRCFGAALHVLEDLFAHSNFVELGLIKVGHDVLPWTSPTASRHALPLVTGRFGGADIIASLATPLAQLMAPEKDWQFIRKHPGERSDTDRMLLVLLSEHQDSSWLAAYQTWLDVRDGLRENEVYQQIEEFLWLKEAPLRIIQNAYNQFVNGMLVLAGGKVDDLQTLTGGDPNSNGSTDPTHSQLAKDHAEHPLHEAAALLASRAVRSVARAMLDHWLGLPGEDPLAVASRFFSHPQDSGWQDQVLAEWGAANRQKIAQANSVTELGKVHQEVLEHSMQALKSLENQSNGFIDYLTEHFGPARDLLNKILP